MKRYVQIFSFDTPHFTGLVFGIKDGDGVGEYWVVATDIYDGERKISPDLIRKDDCLMLKNYPDEYMDAMLERTRVLLLLNFGCL